MLSTSYATETEICSFADIVFFTSIFILQFYCISEIYFYEWKSYKISKKSFYSNLI